MLVRKLGFYNSYNCNSKAMAVVVVKDTKAQIQVLEEKLKLNPVKLPHWLKVAKL